MSNPKLEWTKRAKRRVIDTARLRYWTTLDGRYQVTECVSLFNGLPVIWHATAKTDKGGRMISRHRTKNAATRACELNRTNKGR